VLVEGPLPVAGPFGAYGMGERQPHDLAPLSTVALLPAILAPRRFRGVAVQEASADPVMHADGRTAKAAEIRLRLIGIGAVRRDVLNRVIDPPHVEMGIECIPSARFVGVDGAAGRDALADDRDAVAFLAGDKGQCPAAPLAHDDYDTALAGLFFGKATADALSGLVRGLPMPRKICTIYFDGDREVNVGLFGRDCLAQLVCQDERRLVLAIEIAAQLQRAMPLRAVDEDGDGEKVVADRPLAVLKGRASGGAELVLAPRALPHRPRRKSGDCEASAARAIRLAVIVGPTDALEGGTGLFVRHAGNDAQGERPCCCRKEEMLRHEITVFDADGIIFSVLHRLVNRNVIVYDVSDIESDDSA